MEQEYKYISYSEQDTTELAQNIESEKFPNMIICLSGELGSGKTVFVKGFAQSLGITETVTSPTFNLIKEYDGGEQTLYHMDVYRLDGDKIETTGIEDYFNKGGVVLIEWADTITKYLPEERLDIIFKLTGETTRTITLIPHGKQYEDMVNDIL